MGLVRLGNVTFTLFAAIFLVMPSAAQDTYTVQDRIIEDFRTVVARVEAGDTVSARARLQGIVSSLTIDEGQIVKRGDLIARVRDSKIAPQIDAFDAKILGLQARIKQQEDDLSRAAALYADGFYPKAKLDAQRTSLDMTKQDLASARAERASIVARQNESAVLAPADARVTAVRVVRGSIVNPGEEIARFATLEGVVRLSLPERHAGQIKEDEAIALSLPARGGIRQNAKIVKIYPELRAGAVIADAVVNDGLEALVGERVDVLAPMGERRALLIPVKYVSTRYGIDFVRIKVGERFIDAPVTLALPRSNLQGDVEVLSGLTSGDIIELPKKDMSHDG